MIQLKENIKEELEIQQAIENLKGYVKVVDQIPSKAPRTYHESMQIYLDNFNSPTTKRLYIYARDAKQWLYIDLN